MADIFGIVNFFDYAKMKRKSRPQTDASRATKVVDGTHNPKVVGSSPALATKQKAA
jgi:hypothetical protein